MSEKWKDLNGQNRAGSRLRRSRGSATGGEGLFGNRLADHFGLRAVSTAAITRDESPPLVITHLLGMLSAGTETSPAEPESAFSVVVQLRTLEYHELTTSARQTHAGIVPRGAVSALSLADRPRSRMSGVFDALQFYIPERTLDAFLREDDVRVPSRLRWPRDERDPTALTLSELLLPAIAENNPANSMFVEHLALAFLAHAAGQYGELGSLSLPVRGGLAPWQERRAKEILHSRLGTSLSLVELSRACSLSPRYFAGAFRQSTGLTPTRYLTELRIDRAKHLLLTSSLPLADVAALCGFAEQTYFTRVFSRLVGVGPGHWRRVNR